MYQILFKVPTCVRDLEGNIIEQHSNPTEVFKHIAIFYNQIGQIHIYNDAYSCFGFLSESNQVNVPNLASDVIIETTLID